jgi:alkanesulfonate monooxygenase SsuD/methylene tetrahydromethanopterin reductase-like flavin-dependent oxidoreductase (luciferase family)
VLPAPEAAGARRAVDTHVFLLAGQFPEQSHAAALTAAVDTAIAAETAGFAGVWLAEHHFIGYGVCPSALAMASYLLGRTTRLRVGTAACVLSNRHPVAVAEEAVLLDELSGGRFALGLARGGPWVDLEVFGTGLERYESGFPEALDLVLDWVSGKQTVAGRGAFPFRPVSVVPLPRRDIPLWIAATSPSTVDLAAARGLPLLLGMHSTDAENAALVDRYAQVASAHGFDPSRMEHASAHLAYASDSDAAAKAAVRRALPGLIARTSEYVRIDGRAPAPRDPASYVEHLLRVGATGSAEHCRARLAESAAVTGVRHQLLFVEAAGAGRPAIDNLTRLAPTPT